MKSFFRIISVFLVTLSLFTASFAFAASENDGKLCYLEMCVEKEYDKIAIKYNNKDATDNSGYISSGNSNGIYYRMFEIPEDDYEISDPYYYKVLDDGTVALLAINEERQGETLEIPEKINDMTVSQLGLDLEHGTMIYGTDGFLSNRVKTIKFPSTIKTIGYGMLGDSLKSLNYPDGLINVSASTRFGGTPYSKVTLPKKSLKKIAPLTFTYYRHKKISIPDTVEEIGFGAFMESYLKSVTLPGSVKVLGDFMFARSTSLSSVKIEDGIPKIPKGMFLSCSKLSKITIPSSIKDIGDYAFEDCSKLSEVKFKGNDITRIPFAAFRRCTSLKKITIPNGVTTIDADAFYGCTKLAQVKIPDTVSFIGDDAFSDCSSKIVFSVTEGSFAYNWAVKNGYKVKTK